MLEGIPSRALNHVGHTSWCTFSVVSVDESCSYVLYLLISLLWWGSQPVDEYSSLGRTLRYSRKYVRFWRFCSAKEDRLFPLVDKWLYQTQCRVVHPIAKLPAYAKGFDEGPYQTPLRNKGVWHPFVPLKTLCWLSTVVMSWDSHDRLALKPWY